MKKNEWQPILDGPQAEEAHHVIEAIAHAVRRADEPAFDLSLSSGTSGLAIFFTYLMQAWSTKEDEETAVRFLGDAVEGVGQVEMTPSLFGGFTGVAWAVQHLQGRLFDPEEDDANEEIDEVLEALLARSPWVDSYDLITGLTGIGVYALDRLSFPDAPACVEHAVDRLHELAERTPQGITWHTPPNLIPPHQREHYPEGYFNLGVSHGVPGVIVFLAHACAAGVGTKKAQPLLEGACDWLLAQKLPHGSGSCFGYQAGMENPARSAWCYGDPGIAAALLYAARLIEAPALEKEAVEIARLAVQRPLEMTGVIEAGLCHGAAGLGHIYNRMFQATGEVFLREAARFWFDRALEMRQPDRGVAGYSAWLPLESRWADDPSVLTGAAGIGLALLGATTSLEPMWDRMLLLSIPPKEAAAP